MGRLGGRAALPRGRTSIKREHAHFFTFRGRITPDAPQSIYRSRRFTGRYHGTRCGSSRGSASLPGINEILRHNAEVRQRHSGEPKTVARARSS
jgi:hypothetical protein